MFDPYHKWLGISPKDQPPNHYRLLSLDLFESDPDVIDAAANRQMGYVQQRATGEHMAASQKLLNELTAARLCLLDPKKRLDYDAELKTKAAEAAAPQEKAPSADAAAKPDEKKVLVKAAVLDVAVKTAPTKADDGATEPRTDDALGFLQMTEQRAPETSRGTKVAGPALTPRTPSRKKSRAKAFPMSILIACGLASAALLGFLCYLLIPSKDGNQVAKAGVPEKAAPSVTTAKIEQNSQHDGLHAPDQKRSDDASAPAGAATPKKTLAEPKAPSQPTARGATSAVRPASPTQGLPGPHTPPPQLLEKRSEPAPTPPPPRIADQPKKRTVPSAEVQAANTEQLKEVFGTKPPTGDEKKIELARQLHEFADKTKSLDEKFVLLRKAAEMASAGGDATLMLQLIDEMPRDFDIDVLPVEEKMFANLVQNGGNVASNPTLVPTAQTLIRRAVERGLNETALDVAHDLRIATDRPGGAKYRMAAERIEAFFQRRLDHWRDFQAAQAKLSAANDDADANLAVGRWHCVDNLAWAAGLPFLAKGSDEELRDLAKLELSASSAEGDELVKSADRWWDVAQSRKDDEKLSLLERAGEEYERALGKLDTGLVHARVEKRLAEIHAQRAWPSRREMAANMSNAINFETIMPRPAALADARAKNAVAGESPKKPKQRTGKKAGGGAQSTTIAEGVGFGAFHVGASAAELSEALGQPDKDSDQHWLKWMARHHVHCLMDESRGATELRFEPGFQFPLASGIRFGSSENDLVSAYGKPDHNTTESNARKLEYDSRGVLFWLHDGRVAQIVVFQRTGDEKAAMQGGSGKNVRQAAPGGTPGNNVPRVSLTGPPYPVSYAGAPTDKLSVQYAVMEVVKQAGLQYDFDGSRKNTDPVCRKWCKPNIANQPWPEALDSILTPVGLTYEVSGGTVILKRR